MSNLGSIIAAAQQADHRRESLRRSSPYYPDYIVREDQGVTYVSTILRMEKGGKWYAIHFIESDVRKDPEELLLDRLMRNVYLFQQLGTIDSNFKDPLGREIYPLDENQQPETKRMEELLNGPKRKTN